MEFFLDANMPYSAKDIFRKLNLGVVHARDAGLADAQDKIIFGFAARHKQILVTKDLDFANTMLYQLGTHSGIIVVRLPNHFKAVQINAALSKFLGETSLKEIAGAVVILELGRCRIRKPEAAPT